MKLLYTLFCISSLALAIETRKIVVVMDTGIKNEESIKPYLCNMPNKDATGKGIQDHMGHGTNIAHIILSKLNPKTHCLHIVKWYNTESDYIGPGGLTSQFKSYYGALDYIKSIRPSFVNMSLYGKSFALREYNVVKSIMDQGATVIVAAGNDGKDLSVVCDAYPACFGIKSDRFKVVSSCGVDRFKHLSSNYGGPVNACADGFNICAGGYCFSGTSQATAVYTSTLIGADK